MWISFCFYGDGCYFARGGKVTKTPPGDGSDAPLRAAGAHSHLSPGPPFTRAGNFGLWVYPGVQNQDLFPSYSQATGPFCHPNLWAVSFYRTPPTACLPVGCGGGRWTSCHSFARVGGVRTAQTPPNFEPSRGQCPGARRTQGHVFGAAGRKCQVLRRASPVMGSRGGDAYEHRRKPGVHRRSPLGDSLVPF